MYLRYVKHSVWHFIFSCVIAFALSRMAFLGFYVPEEQMSRTAQQILLIAVLTVILLLLSYSRKTAMIGILVFVAAGAVAYGYLAVTGAVAIAFSDNKESVNPYLYYMLLVAFAIGVWLLTMTKRGTVAVFVAGIFLSGLIQFLYHDNEPLYLILFLAAAVINYMLLNYQQSILKSKTKKISFVSLVGAGLVSAIIVLVLGCGIFYGVEQTIDLPRKELKLVNVEKSPTLLDRVGVSTTLKIPESQLAGWIKSQQEAEVNQTEGESGSSQSSQQDTNPGQDETGGEIEDAVTEYEQDAMDEELNVISYPLPEVKPFQIWILLGILVAVSIVLKILSHRIWLMQVLKKTPNQQISNMYHLYLRKFKQIKMKKNQEETPLEYEERMRDKLKAFHSKDGTVDMECLTKIFVETSYGGRAAGQKDCEQYVSFYKNLFPRLRSYLGPIRFIWYFYRL